jgi:hypothetical protein
MSRQSSKQLSFSGPNLELFKNNRSSFVIKPKENITGTTKRHMMPTRNSTSNFDFKKKSLVLEKVMLDRATAK